MIRYRRLSFALAAFLAVQPAIALVCQVTCRSTASPIDQVANHASRSDCHEQMVTQDTSAAASVGTSPHSCNHFSASSLAPIVAKLQRTGALTDAGVAVVSLVRPSEHGPIQAHDSHAPPGPSIRSTVVLRV